MDSYQFGASFTPNLACDHIYLGGHEELLNTINQVQNVNV
jgi:hypothetical protein